MPITIKSSTRVKAERERAWIRGVSILQDIAVSFEGIPPPRLILYMREKCIAHLFFNFKTAHPITFIYYTLFEETYH